MFDLFREFLRDRSIGSLVETSRFASRKITEPILRDSKVIVELGAGRGAVTESILERVGLNSKVIAIERNGNCANYLERVGNKRVRVYLKDSSEIKEVLSLEGYNSGSVDAIVSGMPFSFFDEEYRNGVIRKSYDLLREGGVMIIYQFKKDIEREVLKYFGRDNVIRTRVFMNLPPLLIWKAVKNRN